MWWTSREAPKPQPEPQPVSVEKKPALPKPKVAKPRPAPAAKAKPAKRKELTPQDQLARIRKTFGDNVPENLKPTVYFLENPPKTNFKPRKRPEDVFKHQSEKTIAAVLLLQPGAFVMRRTVYDESFDIDFKKALEDPTVIEDGDSDEDRELKMAVADVRAELAEKMKEGEMPAKIFTEAMDTAYELGKYTREIETMLREVSDDPTKTDQDVQDFVEAANVMLKEKGAAEIPMPNLVRRQVRLRTLARKARMANESKTEGEKK